VDIESFAEVAMNTTERSTHSNSRLTPERKLIPKLDALRRKRNTGAYDDYGLVSQGEADLAGRLAIQMRREVEGWIRKNHPDKIA
jgi:hypothetical protein